MYSALASEVPIPDDPTSKVDKGLVALMQKHNKVICCGEAKSHCVNWSVRHLADNWDQKRLGDIVLLEDACSAVGGFEEAATTFVTDMKAKGVTVCNAEAFRLATKSV